MKSFICQKEISDAAISTSGDGIFPLLAENRKDGLIVSVFGLVVALLLGYIALALGF